MLISKDKTCDLQYIPTEVFGGRMHSNSGVGYCMVPELMELGSTVFWLSIPVTALISWVYLTMEATGDYSENPFQGMANDIPMLSLCRTIEIDLRQMLNETELPKPIGAKKEILM